MSGGPCDGLTERQVQVLQLLADGATLESAGAALFISRDTVKTHLAKALAVLGARSRTQAVAIALRAESIR